MSTNVLALAQQGANLTPGQRAAVKAIKGFVITGIGAAVAAVFQLLANGSINAARDWPFVAGAGFVAAAFAVEKYATAQGDAPLAAAAGQVAASVAQWAGANDVGNKPAPTVPPPVNSPAATVMFGPDIPASSIPNITNQTTAL